MPAKTTAKKIAAAKPATRRKLNLTRYALVTGKLASTLSQYQGLLISITAGEKIDVTAFDKVVGALNKGIETFDQLTEKHEDAMLEYVDQFEAK